MAISRRILQKGGIFSFLFLSFIAINCQAQRINIVEYTVKNGLAESNVNSIYQDDQGYLWLGTRGGVCKFDGHTFKTLNVFDGLPTNYVTTILQDKKGKFWFATLGGLCSYDGQNIIPFREGFESEEEKNVRTAICDRNGALWFGTLDGIFKLDKTGIKKISLAPGKEANRVRKIVEDKEGLLWFATDKGLFSLDTRTNKSLLFSITNSTISFVSIAQDNKGRIWAGSEGAGLFYIEGDKLNQYNLFGFNDKNVFALLFSQRNQKLYIGTDDGLSIADENGIKNITHKNGLSDNLIRSILEDDEGNIWIGTLNGGFNILKSTIFKNYFPDEPTLNTNIRCLAFGKDSIVIMGNTKGNLLKFEKDKLKQVFYQGSKINKAVSSIVYDKKAETYFIGTYGGGLYKYKNDYVSPLYEDKLGRARINISFIDSKGVLWVGTHNIGLIKIDGGEVIIYNIENNFFSNSISGIIENQKGELLVCTTSGLAVFNNNNYKQYKISNEASLNAISSIIKNDKDEIIVGTQKCLYTFRDYKFHEIEMPGSNLRPFLSLVYFKEKVICGNYSGIHLIDIKKGESIDFNNLDGFFPVEVGSNGLLNSASNTIWVSTIDGLTSFDPDFLHNRQEKMKIHFTGIKLANKAITPDDSLLMSDFNKYQNMPINLNLAFNQNYISINYIGINYYSPESVRYQCRLLGFEEDWQPVTDNTEATYSNLSSGDYTFQVKAITGKLNVVEKMEEYKFSIKVPFWERWWFYVTEIVILVFAFSISMYLRRNRNYSRLSTTIMVVIMLIVTEIIAIYLESYVENFVAGIPIIKLILNVLLAISLSPIENFVKRIFNR